MTALAVLSGQAADHTGAAAFGAPGLAIEILDDLSAAERLWRTFEREAIGSPYQRFDWVAAYAEATRAEEAEIHIVVARDNAGHPLLLLALSVRRRHGLRVASPIGGRHASFNLPLMARSLAPLAPEAVQRMLAEVGGRLRVDCFAFREAPPTWQGVANPLAIKAHPSPSNAYKLSLDADAERTFARVLRKDARKKLRYKENALAKLGEVAYLSARDESEVDLILDSFFRQKTDRFKELGIGDPFGTPAMRTFVRLACLASLDTGEPAIELHALTLDGRVVAVFGGAGDRERLCGMFISFDAAEDVSRCGPGEVLVARVIQAQCERGRRVFDLGVGEARYKRVFCDQVEELVDALVPVSRRGRLYAAARGIVTDLKRHVKQTPWAMRLVARLRRKKAEMGLS